MDINKEFGLQKTGFQLPVKKSKTHGRLLLDGQDVPGYYDKPFALLQSIKAGMIREGWKKSSLKIVAMKIQ